MTTTTQGGDKYELYDHKPQEPHLLYRKTRTKSTPAHNDHNNCIQINENTFKCTKQKIR